MLGGTAISRKPGCRLRHGGEVHWRIVPLLQLRLCRGNLAAFLLADLDSRIDTLALATDLAPL